MICFQSIIYEAVCLDTGKRYVGQTRRGLSERKRRHIRRAFRLHDPASESKFYRAIRKYGEDNFKWRILAIVEPQELPETEERIIAKFNLVTLGLNTFVKSRVEAPKKQSANRKKRVITPEHQAKLIAAAKKWRDENPEAWIRKNKLHSELMKGTSYGRFSKGIKKKPEHIAAIKASKARNSFLRFVRLHLALSS